MKRSVATVIVLMLSVFGVAQADSYNPFSRQEMRVMSRVWPEIREARDFADIDWRSVGLDYPPGDVEAQRVLAEHWSRVRGARDFDDIDWRAIREDEYRSTQGGSRRDYVDTGPFTREEARALGEVWSEIRQAERYDDIDWRAVGLGRAPGSREARAFMAEDWDSLRRAARFDDIDWRAEYRRR